MPSIEEMTRMSGQKKVPLAIQDLRIFWLYVCPICDAYTIHEPRLNVAGHWMVDHRREPVYQMGFSGPAKYVGLAPAESCFVDDNIAIQDIEYTRTVIRVKRQEEPSASTHRLLAPGNMGITHILRNSSKD